MNTTNLEQSASTDSNAGNNAQISQNNAQISPNNAQLLNNMFSAPSAPPSAPPKINTYDDTLPDEAKPMMQNFVKSMDNLGLDPLKQQTMYNTMFGELQGIVAKANEHVKNSETARDSELRQSLGDDYKSTLKNIESFYNAPSGAFNNLDVNALKNMNNIMDSSVEKAPVVIANSNAEQQSSENREKVELFDTLYAQPSSSRLEMAVETILFSNDVDKIQNTLDILGEINKKNNVLL